MEIEIVQLKYMPYRHQLHTHTYIYIQLFFIKSNCFTYRLKVFRSGAFLVSPGREFQVEISKEMRHN